MNNKPGLPEKVARNKEIGEKKEAGVTYRQLSIDYDLSVPRLQQIVNRYRARKQDATRDDK